MTEPVVYFKPGCPFGIRLRTALTLHRVRHQSVRFRDDEDGAARVRDANDGNEISPTVHVAGEWLTNPHWREVRDATSTVPGRTGTGGAATAGTAARRDPPTSTSQRPSRPWAGTVGWALSGAAFALVGYVVVALTLGAGFERDLAAAAEREGVAANAVATSTQALITHDHPLYAFITGLFLLLPPAFLLRAAGRIRAGAGGRLARLGWWTALATLFVWWIYVGLGLGLFADPEKLPPLVRDFGQLTVPLVSALSLLALSSLVLACEAVRGADVTRRSARAATLISISMLLVGCGSEDSKPETATPDGGASTSATSEEPAPSRTPAASPLEGSWHTGPITLEETEATVRRHGLGRYVKDYRENAPFFGDTVLTLTVENGAWDLYGTSGSGQPEPIDYDAEYEVDGDTVVFHHSDGSNTYRWQVDHNTLTLHFVQSTLPGYRGIPDEVFQRALYMTESFTRQG